MKYAAAIAGLKAEWASICNAMADGYWHGTEAEALARIEEIKAQIAELEKAEVTIKIALPAVAVDVLAGHSKARDVSETLHSAYWLHGRDEGTATYLLNEAHKALHDLASEMGYRLVPLETVSAEVAA